jgi:hypothetical protein
MHNQLPIDGKVKPANESASMDRQMLIDDVFELGKGLA